MQASFKFTSPCRTRAAVIMLMLFLLFALIPEVALAMPWDSPLNEFRNNLTGTVATSIAAIVFVVAGLLIAFGEVHGILGTVLRIALGLSFALMANSWIGIFGGGTMV
ncbi:MAG: TrbC/VirB2 family protein [Candidatus Thiodiazotropha lotti]|nr:TrbC/VirB2 family protein [Candidatus Thiodiazotropha lotti]